MKEVLYGHWRTDPDIVGSGTEVKLVHSIRGGGTVLKIAEFVTV